MESIINKIIEIDNMAKSKIDTIKKEEDNIETHISEKLEKEKDIIDNKYAYKKKNLQERADIMFEEKKAKLEEEKARQKAKLQNQYKQSEQEILEKLLDGII